MAKDKSEKFFEDIEGLVEKEDHRLFYKGKYYGMINQERSDYHYEFTAVLEVERDLLELREILERKNYLIMTMRGPCATA